MTTQEQPQQQPDELPPEAVSEQPTLDVDAVFTEHMEAPAPPIDEPHSEHMEAPAPPEHNDEPLSPERGSPAQVGEKAEVVEKEAEFESFDAPSFEAPNFKEEAKPPAKQGGYPRVVEVHDSGVRYTVDLQTGSRRAVREDSGLGEDASLRVVAWSEKPPKSRASQTVGSGTIVLGRGGVRFVPGEAPRRHPRNTDGPRAAAERM